MDGYQFSAGEKVVYIGPDCAHLVQDKIYEISSVEGHTGKNSAGKDYSGQVLFLKGLPEYSFDLVGRKGRGWCADQFRPLQKDKTEKCEEDFINLMSKISEKVRRRRKPLVSVKVGFTKKGYHL